jgi:hypothetical protein
VVIPIGAICYLKKNYKNMYNHAETIWQVYNM